MKLFLQVIVLALIALLVVNCSSTSENPLSPESDVDLPFRPSDHDISVLIEEGYNQACVKMYEKDLPFSQIPKNGI